MNNAASPTSAGEWAWSTSGRNASLARSSRRASALSAKPFKDLELRPRTLPREPLVLPQPLHLLELRLQVAHGLIHEQLLKRPLFNVARFVLLEVMDVLDRTAQDCTLGLFARAIGYNASKLVDALVDIAASATLDFFLCGDEYMHLSS